LIVILGGAWFLTRRQRNEFRLWRVLGLSACAVLFASVCFAAMWKFAPQYALNRCALAIVVGYLPIAVLQAWAVVIVRRRGAKKRERPLREPSR
jgi:amino acid transporter